MVHKVWFLGFGHWFLEDFKILFRIYNNDIIPGLDIAGGAEGDPGSPIDE